MGVKCQIEKKENEIKRVKAPNGEPSVLYESALKLLGNSERALQVWLRLTPLIFVVLWSLE